MRKSFEQISTAERKLVLSTLDKATKKFKGETAVTLFIDNVLTDGEKIIIGRRMVIAQMIVAGYTYYEINEQLQISPNTYTKIRKWLENELPGYNAILKQTKKKAKVKNKSYPKAFTFDHMKAKYPMHFLFFNIITELIDGKNKH